MTDPTQPHTSTPDASSSGARRLVRAALVGALLVVPVALGWCLGGLGDDDGDENAAADAGVIVDAGVHEVADAGFAVDAGVVDAGTAAALVDRPPRPRTKAAPATPRPSAGRGGFAIVEVKGEKSALPALLQAFKGRAQRLSGVTLTDVKRARLGLAVVVDEARVFDGDDARQATVRCRVLVKKLPGDQLAGSLKARADAAGTGVSDAELLSDAAASCGKTLAEDLRSFADP